MSSSISTLASYSPKSAPFIVALGDILALVPEGLILEGALDGDLPLVAGALDGDLPLVAGALDEDLPLVAGALDGDLPFLVSASGVSFFLSEIAGALDLPLPRPALNEGSFAGFDFLGAGASTSSSINSSMTSSISSTASSISSTASSISSTASATSSSRIFLQAAYITPATP